MQLRRRCLIASAALLTGCSPVELLDDTISERGLVVVHDIPYGPGKLAADARRALDVYRPDAMPGKLPTVVFFYGGSWQSGRRQDYRFVAAPLARRGVIVVVPDYRVYPQVQFPAFLRDAAEAVAFALRAAPSWGGDPHRVFVVGHSAGAYIAVMLALDPRWLQAAGAGRDAVAGSVGISGPYDFLPITDPAIRAIFSPAADAIATTQPITFADGNNRPLLLLQGLADTTVQPRNAAVLAARIRAEGGPVKLRTYEGLGHIGIITAFAPLFQSDAPVLDDVVSFVNDPGNVAS